MIQISSEIFRLASNTFIIILGMMVGAQAEEHRHSPTKTGLHYTNHRDESTLTLMEMDNAVHFLRYLIEGGSFLHKGQRYLFDKELLYFLFFSFLFFFLNSLLSPSNPSYPLLNLPIPQKSRSIAHPTLKNRTHPIIRKFCGREEKKEDGPQKFFYPPKSHHRIENQEVADLETISPLLGAEIDSTWSLPSQQLVVGGRTFQIGDVVLCDQKFYQIKEFQTIRTTSARQLHTFMNTLEFTSLDRDDDRFGEKIYAKSENSAWISTKGLKKVILIHHCCDELCEVQRICSHSPCPLTCQLYTLAIRHSDSNEYLLEEDFRIIGSY